MSNSEKPPISAPDIQIEELEKSEETNIREISGIYDVDSLRQHLSKQLNGYAQAPITIVDKGFTDAVIYLNYYFASTPLESPKTYEQLLIDDMFKTIFQPLAILIKDFEQTEDFREMIENIRDGALNYIQPLFQEDYRQHFSTETVLELQTILSSSNLSTRKGLVNTWKKVRQLLGVN